MGFPPEQRAQLLVAPKIGPVVLARLEALGLDSYDKIQRVGIDRAVRMVCEQTGQIGWACRRKALHRAFDALGRQVAATTGPATAGLEANRPRPAPHGYPAT